jgi:hypothetical protein
MDEHTSDEPAVRDAGKTTTGVGGRSRVFVWGDAAPERGLFRRFVDRLRRDDTPHSDPAPIVFRPPVSRRAPGDEETTAKAGPTLELPRRDGWDPPDLDVEPPAKAPPGSVADAAREAAPVEDHGPGPLYRATVQLLPGRLRPLDPDVIREEIRFVRPTGRDVVVTLGWAEGDPPDHITLNHPTVQDRHARMSYVGRRWRIETLVAQHPVQVNGISLEIDSDALELQSGDEVRLGDARFHFLMP